MKIIRHYNKTTVIVKNKEELRKILKKAEIPNCRLGHMERNKHPHINRRITDDEKDRLNCVMKYGVIKKFEKDLDPGLEYDKKDYFIPDIVRGFKGNLLSGVELEFY